MDGCTNEEVIDSLRSRLEIKTKQLEKAVALLEERREKLLFLCDNASLIGIGSMVIRAVAVSDILQSMISDIEVT